MSASLTYLGEKAMLFGNGSDGSIARLVTRLRLYSTQPSRDGSGVVEVSGAGYAFIAISVADWTFTAVPSPIAPMQIVLGNKSWTAGVGGIANIAGAYVCDSSGNPLAWWGRRDGLISVPAGEVFTADFLTIRAP